MKLGLNTGYWSAGPPAGVTEQIAAAERLGFDSIWTAEAYGSDCLTPLAWWGAATEPESTDAVRFLGVARPPERPPDMGECC